MSHSDLVMEMVRAGRFSISRKHIEDQRPWRGILASHVRCALLGGKVISCSESAAFIQGADVDGRILELPVRAISAEFQLQSSWPEAALVHVMSAYVPDGHTNESIRQLIYKMKVLMLGEQK